MVQYVTKTGELTPAKVLQVDRSIFPCQYAIQLEGHEGERWTEENRLRPLQLTQQHQE